MIQEGRELKRGDKEGERGQREVIKERREFKIGNTEGERGQREVIKERCMRRKGRREILFLTNCMWPNAI